MFDDISHNNRLKEDWLAATGRLNQFFTARDGIAQQDWQRFYEILIGALSHYTSDEDWMNAVKLALEQYAKLAATS